MKTIIFKFELLLFNIILFSSQTISLAQTSTITGTVYEKEHTKTTYNTPEGIINMYLPNDIQNGDLITGTVTVNPIGNNERTKNKNLEELLKYQLFFDGEPISSSKIGENPQAYYKTVSFQVPSDRSLFIELKTPRNNTIEKTDINTISYIPINSKLSELSTRFLVQKKVISNDEPLILLHSGSNAEAPQIILSKFKDTEVTPLTLQSKIHSPRKYLYNLPPELSGAYSVSVKLPDEESETIDLINVVNIDVFINKENLARGEKTSLKIQVTGLEECPYEPVQLELINQTPTIIQLENGNQQLFPIDHSDDPVEYSINKPFATSLLLSGATSGNFSIKTTLRIPKSAYTNSIQYFLDNASGPQELNSSIIAIKSDIEAHLENNALNTETNNYLRALKSNLPNANDITEMIKTKSMVVNMLNPLIFFPKDESANIKMANLETLYPELVELSKIPQPIHPFNNLAGEFNTATNILSTTNNNKESLLNYLDAKKMPNDNYTIILNDGIKSRIYNNIILEIVNENTLYDSAYNMATMSDSKNDQDGEDKISQGESHSVNEDGDSNDESEEKEDQDLEVKRIEYPDNVTTFEDKEGKKYRFYKDAQCKLLYSLGNEGELGECSPKTEKVKNEETGKYEYKQTGKYSRWSFQPKKKCIKGENFCTEMEQIGATEMIYEDKNCKRLVEVKTHNEFLCD